MTNCCNTYIFKSRSKEQLCLCMRIFQDLVKVKNPYEDNDLVIDSVMIYLN